LIWSLCNVLKCDTSTLRLYNIISKGNTSQPGIPYIHAVALSSETKPAFQNPSLMFPGSHSRTRPPPTSFVCRRPNDSNNNTNRTLQTHTTAFIAAPFERAETMANKPSIPSIATNQAISESKRQPSRHLLLPSLALPKIHTKPTLATTAKTNTTTMRSPSSLVSLLVLALALLTSSATAWAPISKKDAGICARKESDVVQAIGAFCQRAPYVSFHRHACSSEERTWMPEGEGEEEVLKKRKP